MKDLFHGCFKILAELTTVGWIYFRVVPQGDKLNQSNKLLVIVKASSAPLKAS